MIVTYRTQNNKEDVAINEIMAWEHNAITSIWKDSNIKNYIFVETQDSIKCHDTLKGNRYLRGKVNGAVYPEELIVLAGKTEEFKAGHKIIVTAGPFKNEKGTITAVKKDSCVLLLDQSDLSIPVTISKNDIELLSGEKVIKYDVVEKRGGKKSGEAMKTKHDCGYELEYVYIPAKRISQVLRQGGGNSTLMEEFADSVGGPIVCPNCNKNLKRFWRELHPGCKIL